MKYVEKVTKSRKFYITRRTGTFFQYEKIFKPPLWLRPILACKNINDFKDFDINVDAPIPTDPLSDRLCPST